MILKLTLTGHQQFDGTYDLEFTEDASPFNKREWHWIKDIAGVRAAEFWEAVESGDTDIDVALSVIAVVRAGKARKEQFHMLKEFFMESTGTEAADVVVEDDASPPAPGETPQPVTNTSDENNKSSSVDMNGTGDDHSETSPISIGTPL